MRHQHKAIIILAGGFKKNKSGRWQSSGFQGPVFASHLRVLAAYYLFKKDLGQLIIASGSKGYLKKYRSAPHCSRILKQELVALGVPQNKIIEEKKSNNTYQQIRELKKLLARLDVADAVVISNQYHLPRVKAMLKHLFKFKLADKINFVPAEKIVVKYNPKLKEKIEELYRSKKIKEAVKKERAGIGQIKDGTYNIKQNTSQSEQYK